MAGVGVSADVAVGGANCGDPVVNRGCGCCWSVGGGGGGCCTLSWCWCWCIAFPGGDTPTLKVVVVGVGVAATTGNVVGADRLAGMAGYPVNQKGRGCCPPCWCWC